MHTLNIYTMYIIIVGTFGDQIIWRLYRSMKKFYGKKFGDFVARVCVDFRSATAWTIDRVKIWHQLNKMANSPNINHHQIFSLHGI